jgi:hypothetical protein
MATEGETVATENRLIDGSSAKSWFVRNDQGGRFGPVDFETVKAWACDGRIGPSNEVSDNGSVWRQAASLEELEMDWVAEVTPGNFYGPIHRSAMQGLVSEGAISKQARLFCRSGSGAGTGAAADAGTGSAEALRLAEQEAARRAAALESRCLEAERRVAELESEWAAERRLRASQDDASHHSLAELESRLRLAQDAAAASERAAQIQKEQGAEQVAALRGAVAELEDQLRRAQHSAAAAETELCGLRAQMAEQARVMQAAVDREHAKAAELEARMAHVAHDFETLSLRLDAVQAAHREQAATWSSEREGLKSELHAARGELQRLVAESAASRGRAETLESALAQAEQGALLQRKAADVLVLELRSRLLSAEAELSEQRQSAQQARMQCATQAEAWARKLDEAKREAEKLRAEIALERERAEREMSMGSAGKPVVLEAEAVDPRAQPKTKVKRDPVIVEAEVLSPEPAGAPKAQKREPLLTGASAGGRAGLSLAELEQQARRELARLGAQGPAFFMKKK